MQIIFGIIVIILGYLLGSIPFGLLLTKRAGLGDIREIGSGNIGATNVMRTGNKKLAIATLLLDAAKGIVAVLIAKFAVGHGAAVLTAMAAVAGHVFPYWLQFKGGKGVSTAIAVFWAVYWPLGLVASLTWLAIFFMTRISSFASLMAMVVAPVVALYYGGPYLFPMSVLLGGLVIYRHKDNILRLMRGQEKAFGDKG